MQMMPETAQLQDKDAPSAARYGYSSTGRPDLQVVLEMAELREVDVARGILRQPQLFARMRQEEPERLLRLEHLCNKTYFDVR